MCFVILWIVLLFSFAGDLISYCPGMFEGCVLGGSFFAKRCSVLHLIVCLKPVIDAKLCLTFRCNFTLTDTAS